MSIQQRIEAIKEKRRKIFLPKIEQRIEFLEKLSRQVEEIDSLCEIIKSQCDSKHGPYYNMLVNDPGLEMRLQQVSTNETKDLIGETHRELLRLKKRFSRKSISLQVFGMAGSGKSTFIQSVTGLTNDVVLASEGDHVTGVSSFIYNSDHFETKVYLYTRSEILEIFNKSILFLTSKVNDKKDDVIQLNDFNDIKSFKLKDAGIPETLEERYCVLKYVENFNQINNLINGNDESGCPLEGLQKDPNGRSYVSITNPEQVQQWVAQHNGHRSSDPTYHEYKRFLAVHHVDIYQKFIFDDAGDIVLMDNVGLGDDTSDISTLGHMYQSIADNSDAVIMLYQPKQGGVRGEIADVNRRINNIRFIDEVHEKERTDINELYILLNQKVTSECNNTLDCKEVVEKFRAVPYERKETILIANAFDKNSVRENAVEPLLVQLTNNLEKIDSRKVDKANRLGQNLYVAYQILSKSVASVVSGKMKLGSNEMKRFEDLYCNDLDFSNQLRNLEKEYEINKNKACTEVRDNIDSCINNLTKLISKPADIMKDVEKGIGGSNDIFVKHINMFRIRIYETFSDLNINVLLPLQNKVKDSVINILYNNAKFGRIPLMNYAVEDGPSQRWLSCFIEEKISEEEYPKMYKMFNFILDYQLNIQGLIEYNVAKCLKTIDIHSVECKSINPIAGVSDAEYARKIWSEIVNRTSLIQDKMRQWRDDFSLIPSHSFFARISMFRDMMVKDSIVENELRLFYSDNRMAVWREEFASMIQEAEAFGNWNELSANLTEMCKRNEFAVTLNN